MRIENWVDLAAHGLALRLVHGGAGLHYTVVPDGPTPNPAAAMRPHAANLAAMGFRTSRQGHLYHPAELVRGRLRNQPRAEHFQVAYPEAREVPFDTARHFVDMIQPSTDVNLSGVIRAALSHDRGTPAAEVLGGIAAAAAAYAAAHGLDAGEAVRDAEGPAAPGMR